MTVMTKTAMLFQSGGIENFTDIGGNNVRVIELSHVDVEAATDDRTDSASTTIYLPVAIWDDLGRPLRLTVTIEGGDKLND